MSVYRYKYAGPTLSDFNGEVPGVPVIEGSRLPYVDVSIGASDKAAFDLAMQARGFTYLSTDPTNPTSAIPARGFVKGSTSPSPITSAVFALLPEMTLTLVTNGGDLQVDFSGTFDVNAPTGAGDSVEVDVFLDGVQQNTARQSALAQALIGLTVNSTQVICLNALLSSVAAGSHTIEIKWRRPGSTGAARAHTTLRSLRVTEIL